MNYRKNEIRAGAFIAACILVFVVFLVAISGLDFNDEKCYYTVRFKYIGGISKGSLVRFGGMEVGRVADIRIPNDGDARLELLLEVRADAQIKTDSEASMTTIGFMGANYIEITLGTPGAPRLPPNEMIHSVDITQFSQMAGSVGHISERLQEFLDRLNDLLNEENRRALGSLVQNSSAMLAPSNGSFSVMMENLSSLSLQLNTTLETMNRLLEANEPALSNGLGDVPEVLDRIKDVLVRVEETTGHLDRMVVANSDNYTEIIEGLQKTTQNLEEFSRTIKEQPWTLVRKSARRERKLPR